MSCTPINEPEDGYPFAIYFLSNDKLKVTDVMDKNLNSLRLKAEPWFTSDDIDYYDWSSHCIYLKEDKGNFIPGWDTIQPYKIFPMEWADKPFIICSNDKREYMGYFFSVIYSLNLVTVPAMFDLGYNTEGPSNVLMFDWSWLYIENPCDNPNVKSALINDNKFREGISITLDSTNENTIIVLDNSDTATISYTISITNNDEEDLYILDPNLMDGEVFHYFNSGVVFYNIDNEEVYKSILKNVFTPPYTGYWSPDWFMKISSMESVQRTITLKGYQKFSTGRYLVETRFNSPVHMSKNDFESTDGRLWYGNTLSNYFIWEYKNN